MNSFELTLSRTLGGENLKKLQQVRIGLAGAGGLGSNCAQILVRSGFKKLRLVDFDRVEAGNLNRQFYFAYQVGQLKVEALRANLLAINPDLELETLALEINTANAASLFQDCDAVIEALDHPAGKRLVAESNLAPGKLVVAASGLAGWGGADAIVTRRITEDFYLVGDQVSAASPQCPPLAPGVNVAAAKQADIVLARFLGR
ncbi:MAG: sulfur carrier protein ThiS adenylyltransferase ThiF [Bacillota bacterium]